MNKDRKKRCYNSGKIGGLSYLTYYNNFQEADRAIERMGLIPVNPVNNGLKPSRPWICHMIVDILLMATCRSVYFQSNWRLSRGARIEYRLAKLTGMVIWFAENEGCESKGEQESKSEEK